MQLRSALLLFSATIIAFCLSLFFQSNQTVQSINLDQYSNLQYNEERSHSLEDLERKISPYNLEEIILEIYQKNHLAAEKTRIMEIGTGNGRVLMELKKKFPDIEFYGVNKEKTHTFYRRESFIHTALKFGIFNKTEVEATTLPYLIFQDLDFGHRIPYENNKFDLIFSQGTIDYIKYKFELFSEILRVLKPEGLSFHTDISNLQIYKKGLVLDIRDALAEIRKRGIEISALEVTSSIRFKKSSALAIFPLIPHQPIPENLESIPAELRRPQMGYNLED